jgi:hypothetical protein
MPALHADWGDKSAIWQERAERARSRAVGVTHKYSKRRMLKLAKRYEQMASLAGRAAKEYLDQQ